MEIRANYNTSTAVTENNLPIKTITQDNYHAWGSILVSFFLAGCKWTIFDFDNSPDTICCWHVEWKDQKSA